MTKQHSLNAVAARARRRMARAAAGFDPGPARPVFRPRTPKADFILRLESARGERLSISIHRFMGRVRTSENISVRQLCRGLELLLTKSA